MVYDFKQLHALAAELDDQHAEVPPVTAQPDVVDLRLWRDARVYDIAYKPTDDQRSPGPATNSPPARRPNKKTSPKSALRRPPPTRAEVEAFLKTGMPLRLRETSFEPSPEFVDAEARIRKSRKKLDRLTYEIARLHTRIQCLDPALQQRLRASGFQVEWDHLTEQLTELNVKVMQPNHRFEFVIDKKYDTLIERIIAIDRKLDELEHPQVWWTDKIPKPLEWIKLAMKSIQLP